MDYLTNIHKNHITNQGEEQILQLAECRSRGKVLPTTGGVMSGGMSYTHHIYGCNMILSG